MTATTGRWFVVLNDGREIPFYHDSEEKVSPFERIKEFDNGENWILDISEYTGDEFPEYSEEDSFVLVPKQKVIQTFFRHYR